MEDKLPDNVQRFISSHIRSVEQLEILLLLSSAPHQSWSAETVFRVVQSSLSSVVERLVDLQNQGFLNSEPGEGLKYRFVPASAELREGVAALQSVYRSRRVKVIEAIFATPSDQIRNFADSFKFRKDK